MSVEVPREPFPGVVREEVLRSDDPAEIFAISWAPDGQMLATGAKDNIVRLWRVDGQLIAALTGHARTVLSVTFSPGGDLLASGSADHSIRLWDLATLDCVRRLTGHTQRVTSVAWSGDGELLVSGSDDGSVRCWPISRSTELEPLTGHANLVNCVAVSPVRPMVASASFDGTARLWDLTSPQHPCELVLPHGPQVHSVCFSPDGRMIATACHDATIRIWDVETGRPVRLLEGHTTPVCAVAFSPDGRVLVSKSSGGTVRLWRCDCWLQLGEFFEATTSEVVSIGISRNNILATYTDEQQAVCLWRLNPAVLLAGASVREQYCNAKVVLLGDSGVGKSGLALALTGRPFSPTESTHGRDVWQLDERVVDIEPDLKETREILLWDLAGQPAYRLVHQLHLHDTTVAIIVFDARNDMDPLSGIRHWDRALRQARRRLAQNQAPLRKVLVVARIDRGGVALGRARFAQLCLELEISEQECFETSAKDGRGIAQLRDALNRLVEWDRLPKVTSTKLFHDIRSFIVAARGRVPKLLTVPALCDAFLAARPSVASAVDIRGQFETCIGRLESRGVVRRFAFGNYVLLEPELLDAYAAAIVEAAREEPDGLGIIPEDHVRSGRLRIPASRLTDCHEEELLLIATIESLVRGEIALREVTDDGVVLLFPAQSTRDPPPSVGELRPSYRVSFEGSARSVYATLAVRLTRSGVFKRGDIWRDGLMITDALGAPCGVRLHELTEAGGTLDVLISARTTPAIRVQLEQFVHAHVSKRAIAATVQAEIVITCLCGEMFQPEQVRKCLERNKTWITCPICDHRTQLGKTDEPRVIPQGVRAMDRDADLRRERDAASVRLEGKARTRDFDVFLCHNTRDKPSVKAIGTELRARGYLPWLDEWELTPGTPWLADLESQLESIRSAAVFIGGDGPGPWQNVELHALLNQFVERGCPVIPVILSSVTLPLPKLPAFLQGFTWVDYRVDDPRPIDRLIWGITKIKPRSGDDIIPSSR